MVKTKKLSYRSVVVLGFLVYFFSYAMRLDYSATLVAIVSDLKISKTMASAAVTGSFITYGIGQVICGFVGDKVSPVKMITVAMLGTITLNVLVSFCNSITLITILWCMNGVCQSMLWPPLVRFISEQVNNKKYADAVTIVGISASVGTMFVYLFVPMVLGFTVWRNVFRFMATFGLVIMFVWYFSTRNIPMGKAETTAKIGDKKTVSVWGLVLSTGLILIFFAIILQGILRDGIQTWLPSLVKEQFNLSESSSILSTAVLPVLSILSVTISNFIYHKTRNELKTSSIMFGIAFVATIPLCIKISVPAFVTVFLAALISGCMHGVNHMLISLIPKNFSKYGMVSTLSGLLNAFTYVGASLSTYGFAAIADNIGWSAVRLIWSIIAFMGTLVCVLKIKSWNRILKS